MSTNESNNAAKRTVGKKILLYLRLITLKLSMRTPLMTQTRLEKKPKNVFIVKEFNGPTSGTPWHKTKTTTVVHFDSYYYY
jgi:hypothetical protein